METRRTPMVVELLRFFAVVFFAGLGYQVAKEVDPDTSFLGWFDGVAVGVLLGTGLGYVVGGVLGRTTITAVGRTERSLENVSAEQLVAGGIGSVIGLAIGAGFGWPVLLVEQAYVAFPVFGFVLVVMALLGFRVGQRKREGVLDLFGHRAGLGRRPVAPVALPRLLDTSVAVDGRVLDVVRAGFLHGRTIVIKAVLDELQAMADSGDDLRRSRGRRGLEVLESLRREPGVDIEIVYDELPATPEVDAKLVRYCIDHDAALLTLDTNLAKAAGLAGVRVLNLHALTLALRPAVVAGEEVSVLLIKQGKERGQAVGYLDDGTMVVVEGGHPSVGREVAVRVTSVLTTANGRMVFGQLPGGDERAPRPRAVP